MLYKRASSGPFWCRFSIAGQEIRCSTGTSNRREAEEFEQRARSSAWRQARLGERVRTWEDAVKRWKLEKADKRSLDKDTARLAWFSQHLNGSTLQEITPDVISELRQLVLAEPKVKSNNTVNHYMGLLRSLLRAAVEWEWIESAPKVPMFRLERKEPRFLQPEEVAALVSHLPPHSADMTLFCASVGLRRSNITGLEWSRIDLERRVLYVPGIGAKAGKTIPVYLNDHAIEILKRWQGKHEQWVFVFRNKPVYQVTTKAWREACRKAGIAPGFTFHHMRHTWASWHVMAGTHPKTLQEMGAWASMQMVERYTHLSPKHLAEASKNVSQFLEKVPVPYKIRHSKTKGREGRA